jgi:hypothetical protein
MKSRQAGEIAQLVKAMLLTLEEMGRLAPALQQEEKAARDAATSAAAAAHAAGDPAGAAAAQAPFKAHGNLSVQYVTGLRDALGKAGLGDKLPHACGKVREGATGRMLLTGSCHYLQSEQSLGRHLAIQLSGCLLQAAGGPPVQLILVRDIQFCRWW